MIGTANGHLRGQRSGVAHETSEEQTDQNDSTHSILQFETLHATRP